MNYRLLGDTGIKVSRLCFGALTIGPLQANLPLEQGIEVMARAFDRGVNFVDTAELYQTYPYIKHSIANRKQDIIISSKCYAYTKEDMQESLMSALRAIDRDYIDIFMLHEQESILTIKGHWEALEYLIKAKAQGLVRAVGISTHHVAAVEAAVSIPEIEVIHPIINIAGLGIADGNRDQMLNAIKAAGAAGKGIYGMKALGGGNLLGKSEEALRYVLEIKELASIAVGMQNIAEVDYNCSIFSGKQVAEEVSQRVSSHPRRLHVEEWCQGCGSCLAKCTAGALKIDGDKASVERDLCRLCGYCGAACPVFAIKVI